MRNFKVELEKNFSLAAPRYEEFADIQKETSRFLADFVTKQSVFPKTILDIGAGTGYTSLALMKWYPNASYTLCDISQKMLEEASRKNINNCSFIVADAEKYSFQKYDLSVSNLAMQWFDSFELFVLRAMDFSKTFAFSTLLNTSFGEYRSIFIDNGSISPIREYLSMEEILIILARHGKIICSSVQTYCKSFENAVKAARYFKNIGANLSVGEQKNRISALLRERKEIVLKYDVVFIMAEKR